MASRTNGTENTAGDRIKLLFLDEVGKRHTLFLGIGRLSFQKGSTIERQACYSVGRMQNNL